MTSSNQTYFEHRRVAPGSSADPGWLAPYLTSRLPADLQAPILDFGCGFGATVQALRLRGHAAALGWDIEPQALAHCQRSGIPVVDGRLATLADHPGRFALILCSHVIEHIPKDQIVATLAALRALLAPDGRLLLCVPNAQAHTGAYWAFEDFTHVTAFTSGSVYQVLSLAGFSDIAFIDTDCTAGMSAWRRTIKRSLLAWYASRYRFWNRVTSSATHATSPNIFSYEVKAWAGR